MDGQTDGRLAIAIPRYVYSASRDKKKSVNIIMASSKTVFALQLMCEAGFWVPRLFFAFVVVRFMSHYMFHRHRNHLFARNKIHVHNDS